MNFAFESVSRIMSCISLLHSLQFSRLLRLEETVHLHGCVLQVRVIEDVVSRFHAGGLVPGDFHSSRIPKSECAEPVLSKWFEGGAAVATSMPFNDRASGVRVGAHPEGADFTLYRGRQHGNPSPILAVAPRRGTTVAPESPTA